MKWIIETIKDLLFLVHRNLTFFIFLLAMVLIVSHNCNGLRNVTNFKKYMSIVREKNIDFMLFQETFWDSKFVSDNSHLYDGKRA